MEWEVQEPTGPVAGREPVVANRKLHAQQVGCPYKISTVLAFNNIITNSMPNTLRNPASQQESGEEV